MDIKFVIALFIIFGICIGVFIECIAKKRYISNINIRTNLFNIDEIRKVITSVLESWNKDNLSDAEKYYGQKLIQKHQKNLAENEVRDKHESFENIKIEGLNKFTQYEHGKRFSLEISYKVKHIVVYGKNYNDYLGISRFGSKEMLPQYPTPSITYERRVQKWWFVCDNGTIKVEKIKN